MRPTLCAWMLVLASARPALAGTESVALDLTGGCANRPALIEAIKSRVAGLTLVEAGATRTFRVHFEQELSIFVAELVAVDAVGPSKPRRLVGANCEELVPALALVIASSIAEGSAVVPEIKPVSPRIYAGLSVAGASSLQIVWTGRLFVGIERSTLFLAGVRLGVRRSVPNQISAFGGTGRFTSTLVDLEANALRLGLGERFSIALGPQFQTGVVEAVGTEVDDPRSVTRPWWALGLNARLECALGQYAFIELQVGAVFPLVRDRFSFSGGGLVYQPPVFVGELGLGFGLRFP